MQLRQKLIVEVEEWSSPTTWKDVTKEIFTEDIKTIESTDTMIVEGEITITLHSGDEIKTKKPIIVKSY